MSALAEQPVKEPKTPLLLQVIGPGLITGASDDDPSGIATYSQAGAQFGYATAWTLVITYPLMVGIQEISGIIGRVTGRGIAGNLVRHQAGYVVKILVGLMVLANVCNLGADLGAMGAGLQLLIGGPSGLYVIGFAAISILLEVFVCYARYANILKWLTLSLLAYVGSVLVVGVPWREVGLAIVWPKIEPTADYATIVVAVLGTTISPYLFFWQAGLEVEEQQEHAGSKPLRLAPQQAPDALRRIRWDTIVGMGLSNLIALCIMITTAATLHVHGVKDIQSATQAAEALRPIAGQFAFVLFAGGIIGTGLLALPSLAGSAAYAIGEAARWPVGLDQRPKRAKAFYGAITIATIVGAGINFIGIDPIKALIWSAVLNGVAAVPIMAMVVRLATQSKIMGDFTISRGLAINGWIGTGFMAVAVLVMFATMF
ncbi:MAG TPA: divalent metal cation transporter [Aliidongia sp.]|uniref:NRAMP family divalent metal transporter n=1 Tax=Aliidongia sp. TaxID=1914230 RepID=UPI002DDCDC9E|nr:divalent metal cation transporter [Aliidongia sp.]HEV2676349.1 divalent metal cation transporter [Aliidongia sp.]